MSGAEATVLGINESSAGENFQEQTPEAANLKINGSSAGEHCQGQIAAVEPIEVDNLPQDCDQPMCIVIETKMKDSTISASTAHTLASATSDGDRTSTCSSSTYVPRRQNAVRKIKKIKIKKRIIKKPMPQQRKRTQSDQILMQVVKKLAADKLKNIFLKPPFVQNEAVLGFNTAKMGQCHVCGHSACLESCLECGRKCCPMRTKQLQMCLANQAKRDVKIQKGSTAAFLSPLCLTVPYAIDKDTHVKITQEMILESLDMLEKRILNPTTETLMRFMQTRYPLNPDETELMQELVKKLEAALFEGLVEKQGENVWRLSTMRGATVREQIGAFWEMYQQTVNPLKAPTQSQHRGQDGARLFS